MFYGKYKMKIMFVKVVNQIFTIQYLLNRTNAEPARVWFSCLVRRYFPYRYCFH